MTVGRKRKPTALKLVQGTKHPERLLKSEAVVATSEPTPPAFLCDDAKVEWGRVCAVLYGVGLMTDLDRAALGAYCEAYGIWAQASRAIAAISTVENYGGLLMETSNGNFIQHALVGIANKARQDVVKFAAEFGMTPAARARVEATPPNEKENNIHKKYFA